MVRVNPNPNPNHTFPLLKQIFYYRIFVNASAILDTNLDCNTDLLSVNSRLRALGGGAAYVGG